MMNRPLIEHLALIAGRGAYPLQLAESAKQQGIKRLSVIAFKRETDSAIERLCDDIHWIHLGQYGAMLDALQQCQARHAVMAGQITPTHLFTVRMDKALLALLARLPLRNAETIFSAVGDDLRAMGIDLLPAYLFMESSMPSPGTLGRRHPTPSEERDIALGLKIAKAISAMEIGQTVIVKEGTILAIEAFEGTDAAIERAGQLGGPGVVVVKVAKCGHDMRFDIPVVGLRTLKGLKKIKAAVMAIEAQRSIILERDKVIREADDMGLCLIAVNEDFYSSSHNKELSISPAP